MDERIKQILGQQISGAIARDKPEEIRIKRGCMPVIRTPFGTKTVNVTVDTFIFDGIIDRAVGRSMHTQIDRISRGYINAGEGIRIGIGGTAVKEGDSIVNVKEIDTLVFRIPHDIRGICGTIYRRLTASPGSGMLIYAPPGTGKTTVIRDLAQRLAEPPSPKCVVIVDERGEIGVKQMQTNPYICVLSDYPKRDGITIGIRSLGAQYLVCDEISTEDEACAVVATQNAGVPLIATAHASDPASLMRKPSVKMMHEARVLDYYCALGRSAPDNTMHFDIKEATELDRG